MASSDCAAEKDKDKLAYRKETAAAGKSTAFPEGDPSTCIPQGGTSGSKNFFFFQVLGFATEIMKMQASDGRNLYGINLFNP